MLAPRSNLLDVLMLFFRDDITAWLARRAGRFAAAAPALQLAQQLRSLAAANVDKTAARLAQARPSLDGACAQPGCPAPLQGLNKTEGLVCWVVVQGPDAVGMSSLVHPGSC